MIKKNIPNFFTCLNLLSGCVGIVMAFRGELVWTAYMVGIAAVMDFLDGFVARLLKVHSEIGKQLDSLADMVTFGVVPGIVMFQLLRYSLGWGDLTFSMNPFPGKFNDYPWWVLKYVPFLAFLITIFSAIRLAKFNIDTRQTDSFIGVPTPANSILICSLPLVLEQFKPVHEGWTIYPPVPSGDFTGVEITTQYGTQLIQDFILNPWFLLALTVIMSFLLVAELPLFALKFKNFTWADNRIRYIFLALCLVLLIIFRQLGIPFIIVLYVILSVINNLANRTQSA